MISKSEMTRMMYYDVLCCIMQIANLTAKGYTEINRELSYHVIQLIMYLSVGAYMP